MTGTISPDGSIGPVGLIPFKLKAAAEAGFETVLLPAALTTMLNLLEHWRGSTAFEHSVTETGLQQSRMQLREKVSVMLDEVNQQLTEAPQDTPNFDMAQSLSFPGAIAWLTYARAIFVSLQDSLESSELEQQPEVLVAYAGLASQVNAETETVFPATQLVIDALPASSLPSAPPVADFISGYTNFLVAAGDANLTYLRDVANLTETQQRQLPVTELVPVAFALADDATEPP